MRIFEFGKHLKNIRGKASQSKFAEELGISQTHLSHLEIGRREPTIALLLLLAEKNGIDISYWFKSDDEDSSHREVEPLEPENTYTQSNISKTKSYNIMQMTVPEIIALQAQIRVYLDNLQASIIDYDRRMLSGLLAACQRALDHHPHETQNVI